MPGGHRIQEYDETDAGPLDPARHALVDASEKEPRITPCEKELPIPTGNIPFYNKICIKSKKVLCFELATLLRFEEVALAYDPPQNKTSSFYWRFCLVLLNGFKGCSTAW